MQKKLIALAIAGLASGAAFAQSNVTVYGVMDATYDYVGASKSSAATSIKSDGRVSANSSYLGFKGVEDLGNGLKAAFQIEGGLGNDNAGGWAGTNRDTFVGLAGGFGTVAAGTLTGAARALGAKVDVNAGATGVGYQGALYGRIGATITGVDDRTSNAIAYISPSFSGFSGLAAWGAGSEHKNPLTSAATAATVQDPALAVGFGTCNGAHVAVGAACTTGATTTRVDNVWSLGLNYENGPIFVGYAYTQVDVKSGATDTSVTAKSNRVAGSYKFGTMGQVGLLWDQTDADTHTANNKRNAYVLNGKFNVTSAGSVIAGFGKAGKVDGVANTAATHYFVGYEHALSKRTVLKALYAAVKNDSGVAYNFYNGSTGTIASTVAGQDPHAFQLGVRHSF